MRASEVYTAGAASEPWDLATPLSMTVFYLVRHAHNDFILKKKLAGRLPGIHLNEQGRAQAEALGAYFSEVKVKAVYASPLERAMETAAPIAAARGLEVIPRPDLGEIQYGQWQGKSLKMLRRRKLWPIVQRAPSLARFPNGESFSEAQARVVAELEALRSMHRGPNTPIVCVSHADTIKLAVAHHVGLPLDLFQRLVIAPASISILRIEAGYASLICLNDTRATGPPTLK